MKTTAILCAVFVGFVVVLALLGGCTAGHGITFEDDSAGTGGAREVAVTRALVGVGEVGSASGAESSASSGGGEVDAGGDAAVADVLVACAHDTCSAGAVLDPACDPCVAAVCEQFPGLGCCTGAWTLSCAGAMQDTCGRLCGDTAACSHSVCETGGPLDGSLLTGCSLCAGRVCETLLPSCCTTAWDASCVAAVAQESCGITCEK
jgi:hypothetical protein